MRVAYIAPELTGCLGQGGGAGRDTVIQFLQQLQILGLATAAQTQSGLDQHGIGHNIGNGKWARREQRRYRQPQGGVLGRDLSQTGRGLQKVEIGVHAGDKLLGVVEEDRPQRADLGHGGVDDALQFSLAVASRDAELQIQIEGGLRGAEFLRGLAATDVTQQIPQPQSILGRSIAQPVLRRVTVLAQNVGHTPAVALDGDGFAVGCGEFERGHHRAFERAQASRFEVVAGFG